MNEERIRELIEERKRDAENRGIYAKAREIARRLGVREPKSHGSYWRYTSGDSTFGELKIVWDDYAPNLWITWGGQPVFRVELGDIMLYRPDIPDWLEQVESLYQTKIVPLLKKEKEEMEERRRQELYDRWGIRLD